MTPPQTFAQPVYPTAASPVKARTFVHADHHAAASPLKVARSFSTVSRTSATPVKAPHATTRTVTRAASSPNVLVPNYATHQQARRQSVYAHQQTQSQGHAPQAQQVYAPTARHTMPMGSGADGAAGSTEVTVGEEMENHQTGAKYSVVQRLGAGMWSEVFKAQAHRSNRIVAIKPSVFWKEYGIGVRTVMRETKESDAHTFNREVHRLEKLNHANVVRSVDNFRMEGQHAIYTCIVLEYCDGGSIYQYIKQRRAPFSKNVILSYLRQIASGLEYVHKRGIVHGDFKSDNLMLTAGASEVKITDFGHSRSVSNEHYIAMTGGDMMYAPPEFDDGITPDPKWDMWGCGCIVAEMAMFQCIPQFSQRTGGRPMHFRRDAAAFASVTQRVQQAHKGLLWPLASHLLSRDPASRLSACDVRQHAETLASGGGAEDGNLKRKSSLKRLLGI